MKIEPKVVPNFFIARKQASQYRCTKRTILNGRSKAARKPGPVVVIKPGLPLGGPGLQPEE